MYYFDINSKLNYKTERKKVKSMYERNSTKCMKSHGKRFFF